MWTKSIIRSLPLETRLTFISLEAPPINIRPENTKKMYGFADGTPLTKEQTKGVQGKKSCWFIMSGTTQIQVYTYSSLKKRYLQEIGSERILNETQCRTVIRMGHKYFYKNEGGYLVEVYSISCPYKPDHDAYTMIKRFNHLRKNQSVNVTTLHDPQELSSFSNQPNGNSALRYPLFRQELFFKQNNIITTNNQILDTRNPLMLNSGNIFNRNAPSILQPLVLPQKPDYPNESGENFAIHKMQTDNRYGFYSQRQHNGTVSTVCDVRSSNRPSVFANIT